MMLMRLLADVADCVEVNDSPHERGNPLDSQATSSARGDVVVCGDLEFVRDVGSREFSRLADRLQPLQQP